jgi:Tfp pilus assembly protein PilN
MIRINLLGSPVDAARRGPRASTPLLARAASTLVLLATTAVLGSWYWSLSGSLRQVNQDVAEAEAEAQRWPVVLKEVERLEARRSELQQRVGAVEQLRDEGSLAALLDAVAAALPANAWLLELTKKDRQVTLKGAAAAMSDLTALVATLERSRVFAHPVEITDTEKPTHAREEESVRFSIRTTLVR